MMHALYKCLLVYLLTCLGHHALGSKIIHGKKASIHALPYMASLQNSNGYHVCGGFLISEDFVLTAAHCEEWVPTTVVLGSHDLSKVNEKMRFEVKKCPHKDYKGLSTGNDIMILKLLNKTSLDKGIKHIRLPESAFEIKKNRKCLVAGWGATRTDGSTVSELRVVDVSTVDLTTCNDSWQGTLPANIICAGGYKEKEGMCQGDSGGPLVCNGKAVGIVSFNNGTEEDGVEIGNCDYPDIPNIYTDVFKYLRWIKTTKKEC